MSTKIKHRTQLGNFFICTFYSVKMMVVAITCTNFIYLVLKNKRKGLLSKAIFEKYNFVFLK